MRCQKSRNLFLFNYFLQHTDSNYFGCVVNIESGSTYYSAWYNFDSNPSNDFHPRFACVVRLKQLYKYIASSLHFYAILHNLYESKV